MLAELPFFEYFITDDGMDWIVFDTHHDTLVAHGLQMATFEGGAEKAGLTSSTTNHHLDDERILEFWAWFEQVAGQLAENLDHDSILGSLDARVSQLGDVSWEVGPGHHAANALTITPDGDPSWLDVTLRIVALAPQLEGWEFYPARRAKEWSLVFAMEGSEGSELEVDANPWRYVLHRYADRSFDIVVEQNDMVGGDDDDRYSAAVIVLDGLLGEAERLRTIGGIECVSKLAPPEAEKASAMTSLRRHLESLTGSQSAPRWIPKGGRKPE